MLCGRVLSSLRRQCTLRECGELGRSTWVWSKEPLQGSCPLACLADTSAPMLDVSLCCALVPLLHICHPRLCKS
ncbi:hypothetical protein BV20DRAFT_158228 [Pilatotrama ljubarskyi]|nr:hypothetical protein BV20DRAFT_158228 [Pilatotrama ljubarskyi]